MTENRRDWTTGQRIDAIITDSDMKITDIAEKIGVSRQQIWYWKNDLQEMGVEKLKKFCEIMGVSADYVLGITSSPQ